MTRTEPDPKIDRVEVNVYRIPTDSPESDGTIAWDHTGMVVVHVYSGDSCGFGWTYAAPAAAKVIHDALSPIVKGHSAYSIEGVWQQMVDAVRNAGRPGVCSMAISAVDVALWDLKARLLKLPLIDLFGAVRSGIDIYGSGGFTSYTDAKLTEQLGGWAADGLRYVKMKVGRDAAADPHRVAVARTAIGENAQLFVDANGGYSRKQALLMAERFSAESGVTWFEEPVSSDDLPGLRLLRDRAPAGMEIAAGEYGFTPGYFQLMLQAGAVDCLQADATRCGGYTGFIKAAAVCEAYHLPLSSHCAPQLHAHIGCCVRPVRHLEYFHDHVRIAGLLFDGVLPIIEGKLHPDRARPGHGLEFKAADARKYAI